MADDASHSVHTAEGGRPDLTLFQRHTLDRNPVGKP